MSAIDWSRLPMMAYVWAQRLMTLDITHLMQLHVAQLKPDEAPPVGVEFRFLSAAEVQHFATVSSEWNLTPDLADRLIGGRNFCFGAFREGQLASYAWLALQFIEPEHNQGRSPGSGVGLSFPDHYAFLYKAFTHPTDRGHRLYGHVTRRALDSLQPYGVTSLLSTAEWTNRAALTSCWRVGYEDLGLVWRFGWGRLPFTIRPRRAASLGIRVSPSSGPRWDHK